MREALAVLFLHLKQKECSAWSCQLHFANTQENESIYNSSQNRNEKALDLLSMLFQFYFKRTDSLVFQT